jgi:RNA polymerase sigma factor (sigma-70 family)
MGTSNDDPGSDPELVRRTLAGDAGAFTVLVERHQGLVFGVALSSARDVALAEDAAQDAFVEAWRELPRLRDPSRVGSWIAGIARNLARGVSRTSSRRRALREADPSAAAPASTAAAPSPLESVLAQETRGLLHEALTEIPAAYREVLVLFYVQGQSVGEVAGGLRISEELVKQRLLRGRRALRASMESRVERALEALRPGKAFTVSVVAAVSAAAATRAAAAGSAVSAGKVFMGLSATKVAFLGGAIVVASGVGWFAWHRRAMGDAPAPATHAATTSSGGATAASIIPKATSGERRHVSAHRVDDRAARDRMIGALRQAQVRRAAAVPTLVAPPSRPSPGASDDGEDLDKQYVREAVQAILPLITDCYETALVQQPKLAGRLIVDFTIEGDPDVGGLVTESAINRDSDIGDAGFRECVQETMYAIQIDPPSQGGVVRVTYPFEFRPGD